MLVVVLLSNYLTAFSALSMVLFLPLVVSELGYAPTSFVVGILFLLPLSCLVVSLPLWGRFADRFGKKPSLLRSQLGLTIAFVFAAQSTSLIELIVALVLQGFFSGSHASANAYLAEWYKGDRLKKVMNYTQISALLAVVSGPPLLGGVMAYTTPIRIYYVLAALPMLSFVLCVFYLKSEDKTPSKGSSVSPQVTRCWKLSKAMGLCLIMNLIIDVGLVIPQPYFLVFLDQFNVQSNVLSGLFFSMPQLVVVTSLFWINRITATPRKQVAIALLLLALGAVMHCYDTLILVGLGRILIGLCMLLSMNGLNQLFAAALDKQQPGFHCGLFDASNKLACILAGLSASLVSLLDEPLYPFFIVILLSVIGLILLFLMQAKKVKTTDLANAAMK